MASPQPDKQDAGFTLAAPKAALDVAIDAARIANPLVQTPDGRTFVLRPKTHELQDVTNPDILPAFIKQTVTVDTRQSLEVYVNRFSDNRSILIADYDAGTVTAALDWHSAGVVTEGPTTLETDNGRVTVNGDLEIDGAPSPVAHTCILKLRPSEEFKRWNGFQGKIHAQAVFAAFLEENATDVVDPEPAVLIEISRDLEGIQGVNFKSSTRLENGDRSFVYETETKTKGGVVVPREFVLNIPLFEGEEQACIRCALRWRIQEGGLGLGFEWRRVEYQRRAYFQQLAVAAAESTGLPVIFGRAD